MIINISAVLDRREARFSFSFNERFHNDVVCTDEAVFTTPVSLEGEVIKEENIYYVEGRGSVGVRMFCSRCLEPVNLSVDFKLNEKFGNNAGEDEEIETFSGDSIDLTSAVLRNILAILPMKVVCSDNCRGLCPICGQNLNVKDCGCDTTYVDPRFESLRSLLKFDEEV
ncbi:MAG: DUF177 domain-containing protein [Candidatus Metalachnospira sp.]|nr:DUF177 domain-containing protein [Candidatus Metalachnospira sp.]